MKAGSYCQGPRPYKFEENRTRRAWLKCQNRNIGTCTRYTSSTSRSITFLFWKFDIYTAAQTYEVLLVNALTNRFLNRINGFDVSSVHCFFFLQKSPNGSKLHNLPLFIIRIGKKTYYFKILNNTIHVRLFICWINK